MEIVSCFLGYQKERPVLTLHEKICEGVKLHLHFYLSSFIFTPHLNDFNYPRVSSLLISSLASWEQTACSTDLFLLQHQKTSFLSVISTSNLSLLTKNKSVCLLISSEKEENSEKSRWVISRVLSCMRFWCRFFQSIIPSWREIERVSTAHPKVKDVIDTCEMHVKCVKLRKQKDREIG
jgi:hypothetical protein